MSLHFDHHHRHPRRRRGGLLASEVENQDVAPLVERVEFPVVGHDILKVGSRKHGGQNV